MIILRNMAKIEGIPKDKLLSIMQLFTYYSKDGTEFINFIYKDKVLYVPPNMTKLKQISEMLGQEIKDERSHGQPLSSPFILKDGFQFREGQEEGTLEFLDYVRRNNYGTLGADCGCGKSVMMTYVYGQLQKKTLILLDQKNLIENWQIGSDILYQRPLQLIKATDTQFSDVCVSTFKLLHMNKELLARIRDEFGTLVLEECHSVTASTYSYVVNRLNNFYRISCTATFFRKNLPIELLEDTCSPVSVRVENKNKLIPKVYFVKTGVKLKSSDPSMFSKIHSDLACSTIRNELIVKLVKQGVDKGRKILIIGIEIAQVEQIAEQCKKFCKALAYHSKSGKKLEATLKEDFEAGKIDVLCTVSKARKGLDLQNLDMIILARLCNNQGDLQQITGRALRKWPGKKQPVIIDLVDEGDLAFYFERNRRKWYKYEFGYEIEGELK